MIAGEDRTRFFVFGCLFIEGEIVSTPAFGDVRVTGVSEDNGGTIYGETLDPAWPQGISRRVEILLPVIRTPKVSVGDLVVLGGSYRYWVVCECNESGTIGAAYMGSKDSDLSVASFGRPGAPTLKLIERAPQSGLARLDRIRTLLGGDKG